MKCTIVRNDVPFIEANDSLVLYTGKGNPVIMDGMILKWDEYKEINTYVLFYTHLIEIFNVDEEFDHYVSLISNSQIRKLFNGKDSIDEPYENIMGMIGVNYNYLYDFVTDYRTIYISKKHKSARK